MSNQNFSHGAGKSENDHMNSFCIGHLISLEGTDNFAKKGLQIREHSCGTFCKAMTNDKTIVLHRLEN